MKCLEKIVKKVFYSALVASQVIGCSCRMNNKPRGRIGSYPSATIATVFQDIDLLREHNSLFENQGQVYTCMAGHIDIAHLRKSADWTKFLSEKTFSHLIQNKNSFSFKLKEPSLYFVSLNYPKEWESLNPSEKKYISEDISINLGQYFVYTAVTWHEILTWFGYKSTGLYPEFPSAFSWEDQFSNLLGVHITGKVLKNSGDDFNKQLTLAINQELESLNIQPAYVSRQASEKMRGRWYSGDFIFTHITKRNFDIGEDGFVTPIIISEFPECDGVSAKPYPVPNLDALAEKGFSIKFEIEPREWERDKILNIIKERKRIEPIIHFSLIMEYIRKDAEKYWLKFD